MLAATRERNEVVELPVATVRFSKRGVEHTHQLSHAASIASLGVGVTVCSSLIAHREQSVDVSY